MYIERKTYLKNKNKKDSNTSRSVADNEIGYLVSKTSDL